MLYVVVCGLGACVFVVGMVYVFVCGVCLYLRVGCVCGFVCVWWLYVCVLVVPVVWCVACYVCRIWYVWCVYVCDVVWCV